MSAGGSNSGQDFDLNLAPIIDAFTVLIAFMLVSATFLAIGIFDAGISAGGAKASSTTPPPVTLTLQLKNDRTMVLQVTGKMNKSSPFQAEGYAPLLAQLQDLRTRFPAATSLTLKADDKVAYADVIKTMEQIKTQIPLVLLGGF